MRTRILIALFLFCMISNQSIACDCRDSKDLKEIQNREFTNSKYIFIGEISKIDTKNTFLKLRLVNRLREQKMEKCIEEYTTNYAVQSLMNSENGWFMRLHIPAIPLK